MSSVSPECTADEDEVDPRVKDELETLNFASSEINKLEREIDKAREKFRLLLSDSTTRLNVLYKKLGKCVGKARPYFELMKQSKEAEDELTKATVAYQRANSIYRAAKETVALAEERMTSGNVADRPEFDSAWQEMMNHATMRFVEAEKDKHASEDLHQKCASKFTSVQQKLRSIQKDIPRSINRAKPYFDLKDHLESRLQGERDLVEHLQRALTAAKDTYRESLVILESISEEIHQQRKLDSLPPRTPGVGAEACLDQQTDIMAINLDTQSTASDIFPDESDVASLCSQDVASLLDSPPEHAQVLLGETDELHCTDALTFSREATIPGGDPSTCTDTVDVTINTTSKKYSPTTETAQKPHSSTVKSPKDTLINANALTFPASQALHDVPMLLGNASQSSPESPAARSVDKLPANTQTRPRGRPKDKRVQTLNSSLFPILQGLTETNKRLSPKLPYGRPRGQEVQSHHSPSPVRKTGKDYFEFPEPKLRSKAALSREVSPGPNLFPDSDTSLFEKKRSNPSKETAKTQLKPETSISEMVPNHSKSAVKTRETVEQPSDETSNGRDVHPKATANLLTKPDDRMNGADGITNDGKVFYNL